MKELKHGYYWIKNTVDNSVQIAEYDGRWWFHGMRTCPDKLPDNFKLLKHVKPYNK